MALSDTLNNCPIVVKGVVRINCFNSLRLGLSIARLALREQSEHLLHPFEISFPQSLQ
jgi:hypothetical protein